MYFSLNRKTNKVTYNVADYEYFYKNDEGFVILDINQPKEKILTIENKINQWLNKESKANFETLFKGGYFILHYDKKEAKTSIYRDSSGIKSGYYNIDNSSTLRVSTHLHGLARKVRVSEFNDTAIAMLLALDFCFDGYTIYKDINEFKMGSKNIFNTLLDLKVTITSLNLAKKDNSLSFKENSIKIREEINLAHSNLTSTNNVVYLSGGIDSCVMLAALDDIVDKEHINTISYRVKGTAQDETKYAKSIADYLGVSFEIKEVDPAKNIPLNVFKETIVKMNNPYIGYWIFAPEGDLNTTFFAGQDTRLHTPDVHSIDSYVFGLYLKNRKLPFSRIGEKTLSKVYNQLNLEKSSVKVLKHLNRLSSIGNPENYLLKYVFKFKDIPKSSFLDSRHDEIKEFFKLPENIKNKRQLYNEIVKIKWAEQYTDDIRYMQDLARVSSTYITMPFYDKNLSEFSSSIPFSYASKFRSGTDTFTNSKVKVNKLILREAYKDKLNEDVLYRKKAVSITNFLLFEGALGDNIYEVINDDINSNKSFIKQYGLEDFIRKYHNNPKGRVISDQNYLMKIYYIGTLCVYFKHIIN